MQKQTDIKIETLLTALSKLFHANIIRADYKMKQLHGGTVGDVQLVTGTAETAEGALLPYKVVLKIQKKWERQGDPHSWRREYDLYASDLSSYFTDSLRWPTCYHAELDCDETRIWMEYIDGVTAYDLTAEMLEHAALELGRFQGKLYAEKPDAWQRMGNLSKAEDLKNYYLHCRSWSDVHAYIRSGDCEIPKHLRQMMVELDDNADEVWCRIEKLPIVLCHRDFWVANILYQDNKIALIDWDTAGWGYMGEDVKNLIADEADVNHMIENYQKCVPAYYRGFSEYADVSQIRDNCIPELILVNLGHRLVRGYMADKKRIHVDILQKIYKMKHS